VGAALRAAAVKKFQKADLWGTKKRTLVERKTGEVLGIVRKETWRAEEKNQLGYSVPLRLRQGRVQILDSGLEERARGRAWMKDLLVSRQIRTGINNNNGFFIPRGKWQKRQKCYSPRTLSTTGPLEGLYCRGGTSRKECPAQRRGMGQPGNHCCAKGPHRMFSKERKTAQIRNESKGNAHTNEHQDHLPDAGQRLTILKLIMSGSRLGKRK